MPNQSAAKTAKKSAPATGARKQPVAQPAASTKPEGKTGTSDKNYALVSVLYHTLKGAETLDQYIQDARAGNDEDLAIFFEETREAYVESATEAKALLAERLSSTDDSDDDEDDDDEEEEEDEKDED